MLQPVAAPIVYAKREAFSGAFGEITPKSPSYAEYKKALDETRVRRLRAARCAGLKPDAARFARRGNRSRDVKTSPRLFAPEH